MHKTIVFALATAALGLAGSVAAQDRPAAGAALTRADAEARSAQAFARMDANGDGVLNPADREAHARARFDAADANGDGALTFEEMQTAREERRGEAGEGRRGGRGEMRGEMRGGMRGAMRGGMLRRADSDGDGALSQAEFAAAALARFDAADANHDGTITAEEHRARRGEHRERMRERRADQ